APLPARVLDQRGGNGSAEDKGDHQRAGSNRGTQVALGELVTDASDAAGHVRGVDPDDEEPAGVDRTGHERQPERQDGALQCPSISQNIVTHESRTEARSPSSGTPRCSVGFHAAGNSALTRPGAAWRSPPGPTPSPIARDSRNRRAHAKGAD